MKKFRAFRNNEEAVAGIIVAVLLIGLATTFLSVLQTIYIPDWMEQREAEHLEEVSKQFTDLKFAFDILCNTENDLPVTTTIPLGSKEMAIPFLSTMKGFGTIQIIPSSYSISIENDSRTNDYSIGAIKYTSKNSYFLNIDYILETGALISSQSTGNMMSVNPAVIINNTADVNISFYLMDMIDTDGKNYASGYGNYPIRLQYQDKELKEIEDINSIVINTDFLNSWHIFMNNIFQDSGLDYGPTNDFIITENEEEITIDFNAALNVNLLIKKYDLEAQIGPGWIK